MTVYVNKNQNTRNKSMINISMQFFDHWLQNGGLLINKGSHDNKTGPQASMQVYS